MNPIELSQTIGQALTFLTAAIAIIVALVNKKARTPADDQARAEYGYRVLKERYDESVADRKVLSDTVDYLREQGRQDFDREQKKEDLIRSLNRRITELTRQIDEFEARIARLADKVRNGQPITLTDIYGNPPDDDPLDELERTVAPAT